MNDLQIFKNEQLIPVSENETGEVIVNGRQLHEFLEIGTEYAKWFSRMIEYGFTENQDFAVIVKNDVNPLGGRPSTDHIIKLDMAKEIAMIQRNEKGKQARQYFIQVEKAWNSPEMIMKRALEFASKKIESLKLENVEKEKQLSIQQPKVVFADAVSASHTSILVGDLAKLLKQNGIDTGANRLFETLRKEGYLIKRKGTDYNMPTQKSMELKLFEVKETSIAHSNGHTTISKTPKITGNGQLYFINKFKGRQSNDSTKN
ncbi:phage antirepressor KilAC domain-containing protein [Clostridium estertheticum]|uniref:phage antirepressor KilAC domain-containing protein n=1 Tax=Clostridium estertheticum TaxID=238834 RepID=UPI001C7DCF66|nr:phage antirepressor KilAC domain-containing protein [Clostridium estertheticum]MBX4266598.1 phage antirepressor KilAC domain-containing protein [Clostridium estertheticum]WLC88064.1 phage antirepressor KilAC domain-containing protein [Clostridium estertheticum]